MIDYTVDIGAGRIRWGFSLQHYLSGLALHKHMLPKIMHVIIDMLMYIEIVAQKLVLADIGYGCHDIECDIKITGTQCRDIGNTVQMNKGEKNGSNQ